MFVWRNTKNLLFTTVLVIEILFNLLHKIFPFFQLRKVKISWLRYCFPFGKKNCKKFSKTFLFVTYFYFNNKHILFAKKFKTHFFLYNDDLEFNTSEWKWRVIVKTDDLSKFKTHRVSQMWKKYIKKQNWILKYFLKQSDLII